MRSINARFNLFKEKYPLLGDFVLLSMAVRGQGFNNKTLVAWFNKLVDKSDFSRKDEELLISHLAVSTKGAEDVQIGG